MPIPTPKHESNVVPNGELYVVQEVGEALVHAIAKHLRLIDRAYDDTPVNRRELVGGAHKQNANIRKDGDDLVVSKLEHVTAVFPSNTLVQGVDGDKIPAYNLLVESDEIRIFGEGETIQVRLVDPVGLDLADETQVSRLFPQS